LKIYGKSTLDFKNPRINHWRAWQRLRHSFIHCTMGEAAATHIQDAEMTVAMEVEAGAFRFDTHCSKHCAIFFLACKVAKDFAALFHFLFSQKMNHHIYVSSCFIIIPVCGIAPLVCHIAK